MVLELLSLRVAEESFVVLLSFRPGEKRINDGLDLGAEVCFCV